MEKTDWTLPVAAYSNIAKQMPQMKWPYWREQFKYEFSGWPESVSRKVVNAAPLLSWTYAFTVYSADTGWKPGTLTRGVAWEYIGVPVNSRRLYT